MTYEQPITRLIQQRFSCRSYYTAPISEADRQQMERFLAENDTGPLGNQARFALMAATETDRSALRGLGTYGTIKGATGFLVGAVRKAEGWLEDYGCLMEKAILRATDLGLGTCWLGGTFTKSRFAKAIGVVEGESVPAVAAIGYIAKRPRRIDAVIRRGAGSDQRLPWGKLFFENTFGTALAPDDAGAYAEPLAMVRLAPSASNRQPWRIVRHGPAWHFFLQRTPGYGGGGMSRFFRLADMQRIDMGIAMSHFALTADELGLQGHWELQEPRIERPDGLTEYTVTWMEQ